MSGGPVSADDLRRGVRAQNAAGLERLARRIEPEVTWDDLVLAPTVLRGLKEVAARARHRDTVLTDWRMRRGGGRGHGVTALFAGDSGTGKTMSAEVIASDLGLDLYTVDLATVVDKYIGETEKNLERIFTEAAGSTPCCSSTRRTRSSASAATSATPTTATRTSRAPTCCSAWRPSTGWPCSPRTCGPTSTTPSPAGSTPSSTSRSRRSSSACPCGGAASRLRCRSATTSTTNSCAASFEFAGGNIRSASTTAAYLAAADGVSVGMRQLVAAVEQEYRKLGRLVLEREFGRYYSTIA